MNAFAAGTGDGTGDGSCSVAATGAPSGEGGTLQLNFAPDEVVYIYAEDDNGVPFNCTSDTSPDAVPLHAIEATFTLDESGQFAYGELTGCMVETEAEAICSCLNECTPLSEDQKSEQCLACNEDAIPLRTLLGNLMPTQRCSDIMGVTAYDMKVAFAAARMSDIPGSCGG